MEYGYGTGENMTASDMVAVMTGQPVVVTFANGNTSQSNYDAFGRTVQNEVENTGSLVYTYTKGNLTNVNRTASNGTQIYSLSYDNFGNTTEIKVGNTVLASDTYYPQNGNLQVQTYGNGDTIAYTYDKLDRIIKTEYSSGRVLTYTYNGDGQLYRMTDNNGTAATSDDVVYLYNYDSLKRLISSGQKKGTATELSTASDGTTSITFAYDMNGIRTNKTVGTTSHNYIYAGGKLIRETIGTDTTLDFLYDQNGKPYAMMYNGEPYYYITNLQGDVVRLVDENGVSVATYQYNAWGEIIDIDGELAEINPLRYRGYYYDAESGFYYLQSRYYDPAIGRFINADSFVSTGQGFLGYNMFAYCGNCPTNRADNGGDLWHIVAGAALGGLLAGAATLIESKLAGDSWEDAATKALISATYGAVGGALAATGIGVVGQGVIGGILGAAEYVTTQSVMDEEINAIDMATSTICGIAGGFIGGDGASCGSKFMKYHSNQFWDNAGLYGIDDAIEKYAKHTWKWAKSNLWEPVRNGVLAAFAGNKLSKYYMYADPNTLYEIGY